MPQAKANRFAGIYKAAAKYHSSRLSPSSLTDYASLAVVRLVEMHVYVVRGRPRGLGTTQETERELYLRSYK
jgi:hypothetical protein